MDNYFLVAFLIFIFLFMIGVFILFRMQIAEDKKELERLKSLYQKENMKDYSKENINDTIKSKPYSKEKNK